MPTTTCCRFEAPVRPCVGRSPLRWSPCPTGRIRRVWADLSAAFSEKTRNRIKKRCQLRTGSKDICPQCGQNRSAGFGVKYREKTHDCGQGLKNARKHSKNPRVRQPKCFICSAQTQVWGKHSAWLSAPRLSAAIGDGFAGRSPRPLPCESRRHSWRALGFLCTVKQYREKQKASGVEAK